VRQSIDALEDTLLPELTVPGEPSSRDYRRIVLLLASIAVGFFLPSLLLAGVPDRLWILFVLAAVAAATWIAGTFILVPREKAPVAFLAAAGNALVVGGIGLLFGPYYHEVGLLYALLVASHAVVHGLAPSLIAVVIGTVLIPFVIQDPGAANWSDPFYAALYLTGTALLPWATSRLAQRRAALLLTLRQGTETERSRLAAILSSMRDGVLAVDGSGTVVISNRAYETMLAGSGNGLEPEGEGGRALSRSSWPRARAARGDTFNMAFTLKATDGERHWFEATGSPIAGRDGPAGGVVVIRDITDRSLRRRQEEFMAVASHELRTPVAALHGYVQLLERHLDPTANAREAEYAKSALLQTRRLGVLLDRLFDLARLQTGQLDVVPQPMDLVSLVRLAVASTQAVAPDREFHLELAAESLRVHGDPGRVEEVLLNVLGNAVTHAPESKRIDVRVRHAAGKGEVEVQDFGPGISAADLSRLYRFPRRGANARGGLGLGLYLSRELMRAQSGTIEVTSAVGKGTKAILRLPLSPAPKPRRGVRRA
jgi:signal transduction histidine kinase